MSILSLDINGNSITIDSKVFVEYTKESYRILDEISELNKDWKELVASVEETTKLPKKDVGSYLKARFKLETDKPAAQASLYEALDNVLEG